MYLRVKFGLGGAPGLGDRGMSVNLYETKWRRILEQGIFHERLLFTVRALQIYHFLSAKICKIKFLLASSTAQPSDLSIGRVQETLRGSRRHYLVCLSLDANSSSHLQPLRRPLLSSSAKQTVLSPSEWMHS